ncbi:MAG TPA: Hsp20/alpha crystallin family protein [Acetobacteraceae bacterium]|nr:Hsp20/alpha crystallin family protein [Acetobacteraceae bacterium]
MVSRFLAPFSSSEPFGTLQREINRVFDEVFRGVGAPAGGAVSFAPSIDVHETPKGLEITAELPGCSEKDIQLNLEGDLITIAGEKAGERREEREGMRLSERSYGSFRRSFRLPFVPEQDKVTATFDKGVLTIELPRPAQAQPASNRIPIRGAAPQGPGAAQGARPQTTEGQPT